MSKINKLIIAGILVLGLQTACARAEDAAAPKPPDLTAGGKKDATHDWLLGPTGLRGWIFGKPFADDARRSFGHAIAAAEALLSKQEDGQQK